MNQFNEILQFAIPCWLVNLSLNGIYVAKLYFPGLAKLDKPIDGRTTLGDHSRILGESTTWLGVLVALLAGPISVVLISSYLSFMDNFVIGILTGASVYCGHALGSFIKRRLKYADGRYMPFVDHADYIILAGASLGLLGRFSWLTIVEAVAITYIVHPIVTYIAYLFGWHKDPF